MASFGLHYLLLLGCLRQPVTALREGDSSPPEPSIADTPSFYPANDFLLVSSPTLGKVFWTRLNMMASEDGQVNTLIDSLTEPKGLAFDHERGLLYVADSGAEQIFRYTVLVTTSGSRPTLTTTHARIPVVENCGPVEWVTLDDAGNLFYSSPKANTINKISLEVMSKLQTGQFQASSLKVISEESMESGQTEQSLMALSALGDVLPRVTDSPPLEPQILSIYEGAINRYVAHPAAILVDGEDLYWTNQENGTTAGTVVKGQVDPNTSVALSNMSSGAGGLAKTDQILFFVRSDDTNLNNGTFKNGTFVVSGMKLDAGNMVVDAAKSLQGPRAVTWDRDRTMYVADETQGIVFSFPGDRFMANVPLKEALRVEGPFGLSVFGLEDPCFTSNTVLPHGGYSGGQIPDASADEKSETTSATSQQAPAPSSAPSSAPAPASFLENWNKHSSLRSHSPRKQGRGLMAQWLFETYFHSGSAGSAGALL